jgi:competence protein ComGC
VVFYFYAAVVVVVVVVVLLVIFITNVIHKSIPIYYKKFSFSRKIIP